MSSVTDTVRVRIGSETGRVFVRSPYNARFVAESRKLNGKWLKSEEHGGEWAFDGRDESRVRALCLELYGTDGRDRAPLVTVQVCLDNLSEPDNAYTLGGRTLCRRGARDYRVELGDGVAVLSGGFPGSGGSVKNPSCRPHDGTVLEVRDFPEALAREWDAGHPGVLTILPQEPPAPTPADPLTAAAEAGFARINAEGAASVDPRAETIARIRALMAEHGITADEVR